MIGSAAAMGPFHTATTTTTTAIVVIVHVAV